MILLSVILLTEVEIHQSQSGANKNPGEKFSHANDQTSRALLHVSDFESECLACGTSSFRLKLGD